MEDTVLIGKHDYVTVITINSPEVRNAIDHDNMPLIRQAVEACGQDGTRVIILTGSAGADGSKPAFSSGLNIKKALSNGMSADTVESGLRDNFHLTLKALRASPCIVIGAVDGYAAGFGCDLALNCDLRLISDRARFAELFTRIGLLPDGGGTYLLPRLVGLGRAMELILTARDVLPEEAVQIGLASRVIPHQTFIQEVLVFAHDLSKRSPLALRAAKHAMIASLDGTYEQALDREAAAQYTLLASEDGMEGFAAFLEKRDPVWKAR